jgi:predicted dienelactone hydrolase
MSSIGWGTAWLGFGFCLGNFTALYYSQSDTEAHVLMLGCRSDPTCTVRVVDDKKASEPSSNSYLLYFILLCHISFLSRPSRF